MKKRIALSVATAAVLATVGIGATAAAAAEPVVASGHIQEGSASADRQARNGTEYVGGGTWSYGVWDGQVHSVYANDRSTHRASVKSSGTVTRSAWMPPTKVAYAHRAKALSGNQAFWATRG
jgi:lactococcin 972 family bacteriocin